MLFSSCFLILAQCFLFCPGLAAKIQIPMCLANASKVMKVYSNLQLSLCFLAPRHFLILSSAINLKGHVIDFTHHLSGCFEIKSISLGYLICSYCWKWNCYQFFFLFNWKDISASHLYASCSLGIYIL